MKRPNFLLAGALLLAMTWMLGSCLKDNCSSEYHYATYTPVYKTMPQIRAAVKSEDPQPVVNPGKIYFKDGFLFINELNKGIHVIDDRDASSPKNIAFLNIPGNVDMAVEGNILYADSYVDMLAIDISRPEAIQVVKRLEDVFPWRVSAAFGFGDDPASNSVITKFVEKDTVIRQACNSRVPLGGMYYDNTANFLAVPASYAAAVGNTAASAAALTGIGGSMARFAILQHYLYTVSNDSLQLFDISNEASPVKQGNIPLGIWIETIFPYNNHLFIGSQIGMYIYDATNPASPKKEGTLLHDVMSCDPVVAQDTTAYVTLRTGSGSICHEGVNQLQVINIAQMSAPSMTARYNLTNPQGLAIDGLNLIVCDGTSGIRFMDAANPLNIYTVKTVGGLDAHDVILFNHVAMVVTTSGLYQYDYSDLNNPKLLSVIPVKAQS